MGYLVLSWGVESTVYKNFLQLRRRSGSDQIVLLFVGDRRMEWDHNLCLEDPKG